MKFFSIGKQSLLNYYCVTYLFHLIIMFLYTTLHSTPHEHTNQNVFCLLQQYISAVHLHLKFLTIRFKIAKF